MRVLRRGVMDSDEKEVAAHRPDRNYRGENGVTRWLPRARLAGVPTSLLSGRRLGSFGTTSRICNTRRLASLGATLVMSMEERERSF